MGNKTAAYWIVALVAAAGVAAAIYMVRSADPHTHLMGRYLGWGAIALLVFARFALRPRRPPEPPLPRD